MPFNAWDRLPSVHSTFPNYSSQTQTQWSYIIVHCLMFWYVVILSMHEDV